MTDSTGPQTAEPLRIPIGRNITYAVRGMPNVPNAYGPGFLVPAEISLTYRAAEDSRRGRLHAYVSGRLWVDGAEVPLLKGGLYGQHYDDGLDGWPEWLAEEARLHDPDADRAAVLDEAADDEGDELVCVDECGLCDACGMEPFGTPAEGWREAARFLRRTARESGDRQGALHGARLIEAELRRLAAEERDEQQAQANLDQLADGLAAAIASCPGRELDPNPCRCPCYGCKHHCGAHDPGRVDGEEQQAETQAREETGSALARYIVEQPVSVVQAALRILGWPPLRFELVDDPATPAAAVAEPGTEN